MKKILKKFEETLRIKIWSEMRLFGKENERAIERKIERNEGQIARGSLNRPLVNLNR